MDTGSELASSAKEHAKTFASELEGMARRNPLGTIAGALLVGVIIGFLGVLQLALGMCLRGHSICENGLDRCCDGRQPDGHHSDIVLLAKGAGRFDDLLGRLCAESGGAFEA